MYSGAKLLIFYHIHSILANEDDYMSKMIVKNLFINPLYYTGLILVAIPTGITCWLNWETISTNIYVFIFVIGVLAFAYSINQYYLIPRYLRKERTDFVKNALQWIQPIKELSDGHMLRANVCIRNDKEGYYSIEKGWHLNMDHHNDRYIKIPINRGCTGNTWTRTTQIWQDYPEIFDDKRADGLPKQEIEKVWADMRWICSTPIISKNKVVGVLNIDGDQDLTKQNESNGKYKELIKNVASRIATELSHHIG